MKRKDWAIKEAETHLHYLFKCPDEAERIKYLATALRAVESRGSLRGVRDAAGFKGKAT